MKNIKDITISIFAVIGFVAIITGFTTNESNESQQITYGTPESHVWEIIAIEGGRGMAINKVTGEGKLFVRSTKGALTTGMRSYKEKELGYGEKE